MIHIMQQNIYSSVLHADIFTVWISIGKHPSELMQVRPQLSRSNCKNIKENSVKSSRNGRHLAYNLVVQLLISDTSNTPSFQL